MTVDPAPDMLATRPLRNWLLAWQIWTGDSATTIARGFGLDSKLVVELLADGHPRMLPIEAAVAVADALGVELDGVFGRAGSDDLWSEVPRPMERLLRGCGR